MKELDEKGLGKEAHQRQYERIVEKSCICVGLGIAALAVNELDTKVEGAGVSVCPGPNMAYFSEVVSLKEMVDHIYGRINIMKRKDRPFFFLKELSMYVDYYRKKVTELEEPGSTKQLKYLEDFRQNLNKGIDYYKELLPKQQGIAGSDQAGISDNLEALQAELNSLMVSTKVQV